MTLPKLLAAFFTPSRRRAISLTLAAFFIFGLLGLMLVAGLLQPRKWSRDIWVEGIVPGSASSFKTPPYGVLSYLLPYHEDGTTEGTHLFILGSDGGGRDMLGLLARGALPSITLVALVVLTRTVVGVVAGFAMAAGSGLVRAISRGMGRWVAGFPYLALAIIVIQALSPSPDNRTTIAFVVGMSLVGWREIAEVTARVVENVRIQPYSEAARALGSEGLTYLRRHVLPHLRPALATELPFQASAVLVLLGELGFLQVYLGGKAIPFVTDTSTGHGPLTTSFRLLSSPELGQMLADARNYILKEQWLPVMMPALTLALLALAFEMLGLALRFRDGARNA
jgi:ABC-type dipeptide/oligopeptide/nickel transport system permease subunit